MVHDGHLFIQDHIRVVSHAVRYHILTLKQVYIVVIGTNIKNRIGYFFQHRKEPPFIVSGSAASPVFA